MLTKAQRQEKDLVFVGYSAKKKLINREMLTHEERDAENKILN